MAKLRKYETIVVRNIYEVDLTEDQLKIYNEDEDKFWNDFGDGIDWEFIFDDPEVPEDRYEIIE